MSEYDLDSWTVPDLSVPYDFNYHAKKKMDELTY